MDKTILIIDDSSSMRQMMAFTLGEAGYKVIEAEDGEDGLAKLAESRVNMVITDMNMPKLNGIEFIISARSTPESKFIPIVVLSTESHSSKKEKAKKAGATGWIVKPFDPEKLLDVVKKVMG